MINILEKIMNFRQERNWTEYQLAEKSGLPQSTISSWYRKNQIPSVQSLEKIYSAFNITLSQFFSETNLIELSESQSQLIHKFNRLNQNQQKAILDLLSTI